MSQLTINPSGGLTFIELIIVVAVLSVFLSGSHSWYANHLIRTKINQALSEADSAKMAINIACAEDPSFTALTNNLVAYNFPTSLYVKGVMVSGSCTSPIITVLTVNTGLLIDPTLTITGNHLVENRQLSWTCASDGLDIHVPDTCQS
jgi:prepilin-type N-terminal cleavage/methylation domain-containing protein